MDPGGRALPRARILALAYRYPAPQHDGARIRIFNLARELAQDHTVDLYALHDGPGLPQATDGNLTMRAVRQNRLGSLLGGARSIVTGEPMQIGFFRSSELERIVREQAVGYDLVFCFHLRMAPLAAATDRPAVLDLWDCLSWAYRQAASTPGFPLRPVYRFEAGRMERLEATLTSRFERIVVASPGDGEALQADPAKVAVVPMGVPAELCDRPVQHSAADPATIVSLGQMGYHPNIDAARFFATEVMPLLRRTGRRVRYAVVGATPTRAVRALATDDIEITGFVEDAQAAVASADVFVAPLRVSTGTPTKVLEAMALRRPVVTTPRVAAQIGARDGVECVVASDAAGFAAAVEGLLADRARRERLGANARELVRSRFTWDVVGRQLRGVVGSVLAGSR